MTGKSESKMISRFSFLLGMVLYAMTTASAAAHSSQDAMDDVQQSEPYLQPVNKIAPDFNLEDAWGRQHALADYRGKVVILNFIYTRCKEACPLHNVLLAKIQKQIQAADMQGRVQFVTISTDTEYPASTVAIMRNYGKTYVLDPENWVLLSGAASNAHDARIRVTRDYGLDFVVVSDEIQMHGVVTHIIDPQGQLDQYRQYPASMVGLQHGSMGDRLSADYGILVAGFKRYPIEASQNPPRIRCTEPCERDTGFEFHPVGSMT